MSSAELPPGAAPPRSFPWAFVPVLAGLIMAASFAPARLKLLGIFPVAVGAAAGWLVVHFLHRRCDDRRVLVATALLVPLTMAAYGVGSFLVWRQARVHEIVENLLAQPGGKIVLEQIRSNQVPQNDVEAEFLNAYRTRMNPPVSLYLTERLKELPIKVTLPWAAVFATVELLEGCVAGIVTAMILTRRAKAPPEISA